MLLPLTIGDKGSYLNAAFGAPVAHEDDARRAVSAALELQTLSSELDFIRPLQIGITRGGMRAGAYGGMTRRTYDVMGDDVNLAARLMQAATPGQVLASGRVRNAASDAFAWQALSHLQVKGKAEPIPVTWARVNVLSFMPHRAASGRRHCKSLVGKARGWLRSVKAAKPTGYALWERTS